MKLPYIVGLTGQSGAGKTTLANIFRQAGNHVLDADIIARKAMEKGSPCLRQCVLAFGEGILLPDGSLDRKKLAGIVFSDREKLKMLDDICYPHIDMMILKELIALGREKAEYVLLDAPTLFEAGADIFCDMIISVTAPEDMRISRIMARDGISEEAARARIASQHDEEFFKSHSDICISNSGSLREYEKECLSAVMQIMIKPKRHRKTNNEKKS